MTNKIGQSTPAEKIHVVLGEALRDELARIILEQDMRSDLPDDEIDRRIEVLDQQSIDLKRDARRNDFTKVESTVSTAAGKIGLPVQSPLSNDLGRRAIDLIRAIMDLEGKVLDGEDARAGARPLVAQFSDASVDQFVSSKSVSLSEAWDKALKLYPSKDMKGNIDAIAKIAVIYFADIPVATIADEDQEDFFVWMARLPKKHGKRHGKNRFHRDTPLEPEKYAFTKQDEIDEADAADEEVLQEIRGMNHLSDLEKRALLAERLTARITMTTIRRNRDGLNRLFKAAGALGCNNPPVALSYKRIEAAITSAAPDDPLYVRVTQPKIRLPWTEERIAQFLTSPIFTGCFSKHRRWRPGSLIIRDSLYWVPLIILAIGSRIEEILLLKRMSLRLRNGVYCLAIGIGAEVSGKTEDSERIVPIPQFLLDLGFVEWIQGLDDADGPLLFPDAARRTKVNDVTGPFSKALNRLLDHLGLGDFDEDFYAMRKTLSSILRRADVSDGQRQALAGHKSGSILNRHYTAHHTRDLKTAVDKADFKLEIVGDSKHGFPTIAMAIPKCPVETGDSSGQSCHCLNDCKRD